MSADWILRLVRRLRFPSVQLDIAVIVEQDDDGSFHAYAPGLKGLHASGSSVDDALDSMTDGIPL